MLRCRSIASLHRTVSTPPLVGFSRASHLDLFQQPARGFFQHPASHRSTPWRSSYHEAHEGHEGKLSDLFSRRRIPNKHKPNLDPVHPALSYFVTFVSFVVKKFFVAAALPGLFAGRAQALKSHYRAAALRSPLHRIQALAGLRHCLRPDRECGRNVQGYRTSSARWR